MFYYKNWRKFCKTISSDSRIKCTASESLRLPYGSHFIVLKHDVEANVPKALKLAEIEHQYGIKGSYYVQAYLLKDKRNVAVLKKMQEMGHEISYHYDVLDANSGDYIKADADFAYWINCFKKDGFCFSTICQHGNPIKKRIGYNSNRDFFRNKNIKSKYPELTDMVVDYSCHAVDEYIYISDAGYVWKHITEPETNDIHKDALTITIGNFSKLIKYIAETEKSIILSTHPHRWKRFMFTIYSKIIIFKTLRCLARILEKFPFTYNLLSKFYFIAKKI